MSSGGGVSVSIPNNVRKMIQNIKEITGGNNYSEDEIYAMLKECSMDPNETTQKLLLQDPFHEVKRKRDRKKENVIKESTEPRGKPGMQGQGNRGGRGNYSARHISNGGGRTSVSAKENGIKQGAEDGPSHSMPQGQKKQESFVVASSSRNVPDGSSGKQQSEATASGASSKLESRVPEIPPVEASKVPTGFVGSGSTLGPLMSSSNNTSASKAPPASPWIYLSDSDPILMPSQDSRMPVGTIRCEVRTQKIPVEEIHETPDENKSTAAGSEGGNSSMQGKAPGELQGAGKILDSSRPGSSSHVSFSVTRPSSNYNTRAQQAIGPQKAGPNMEWKPKPVNLIIAQGTGSGESVKVPEVPVEAHTSTLSSSNNLGSKDATRELEKKLKESHISNVQHVIIPDHLHVPEAEKLGFYFGSFDPTFAFNASSANDPVSDKSSEASEVVDESIEEQPRNQNTLASADEGDHLDHPTSFSNIPENLSVDGDVSSNSGPEYQESKQEPSLPTTGHQYPVHKSPNYSFGFMPPMTGNQLTSFESNESQGRDGFHVPSFVVQQPFDPASYYAQFYRSDVDGDGHISPPHSNCPTKFNGNVPVISSQEVCVGNSVVTSSATAAAIQPSGVMQNSIAVTQQPLSVSRPPTGIHFPHYPPNFIPYGQYFSPYYVPPPSLHQFLSNGPYGSNPGGYIGMPGTYGPYGSNPAGYNPGSATTAGNSTSNDDLGGPQFKENNVYMTGRQSEGTGVWFAALGQDISGLQANSFYNLPQAGQVSYGTQAGHGTFTSMYNPAQPVTTGPIHPLLQLSGTGVDTVGPAANVYQQPQNAQINWPNNY